MILVQNQSPKSGKLSQRPRSDLSKIPPEMRLVLYLLKHGSRNGHARKFAFDAVGTVDWDLFLGWTERHKVGPQVLAALSGRDERLVPEHVLEYLRLRCRRSAMASLVLAARTVELVDDLQSHDIRVLPIKGLCAGQQLYGAVEAREPGDIDLLVAPEDAETVDNLLRSQGYQCADLTFELTLLQKEKLLKWAHSLEYIHPNGRIRLDLHWRLFAYCSLLSLEFNTLWNQGELVDLAGHKVRTLSLEHALLLSVAHGASHGWCHLIWLCDLAQVLRSNFPLDWNGLVSQARHLGVIRHLTQGLVLANVLLGTPIPEEALPYLENQPLLDSLIAHSITRWTSSDPDPGSLAESVRQVRYLLNLSDKLQYKWEILSRVGLHPPDWKALPVPDVLFPLYYILRPVLWLRRRSGRAEATFNGEAPMPGVGHDKP